VQFGTNLQKDFSELLVHMPTPEEPVTSSKKVCAFTRPALIRRDRFLVRFSWTSRWLGVSQRQTCRLRRRLLRSQQRWLLLARSAVALFRDQRTLRPTLPHASPLRSRTNRFQCRWLIAKSLSKSSCHLRIKYFY
jgi:hypothetical protein